MEVEVVRALGWLDWVGAEAMAEVPEAPQELSPHIP